MDATAQNKSMAPDAALQKLRHGLGQVPEDDVWPVGLSRNGIMAAGNFMVNPLIDFYMSGQMGPNAQALIPITLPAANVGIRVKRAALTAFLTGFT